VYDEYDFYNVLVRECLCVAMMHLGRYFIIVIGNQWTSFSILWWN